MHRFTRPLAGLLLLMAFLSISMPTTIAQDADERHVVQEYQGYLHPNDEYFFELPDLIAGDVIYLSLENISGNLDPYLRFGTEHMDSLLAEDDDSGHGYDAQLMYEIEEDGNYAFEISNHLDPTFGEYHLWMGLNAPEVLTGNAESTNEMIAYMDVERSEISLAVEEFLSSIDDPQHWYEHELAHLNEGHTLYVYLEATSGDLIPHIELLDFSRKILISGDADEENRSISFSYPIVAAGDHYDLKVGNRDGETTGGFRLLVGLDSPTVLEGHAHETGDPLIKAPTEIQVGIEVLQITNVDQKSENFAIVGVLRAEWVDHRQAFDASDCQCNDKVYTDRQLVALFEEGNLQWPRFRITNQQEERSIHEQTLIIHSDGTLLYDEHFSATLQAPEFDFRPFPFDHQDFWIRIETRFHDDVYTLAVHDNPAFNRFGEKLGEEEWLITESKTEVHDIDGTYQFSLDIVVKRHVNFYIYRLLLPIMIILIIGWAIFFLNDNDARIAASSGNLLIFIAFNFTIGDDIPRLGYLTFLDMVLVICFVITSLVFAINVYLKRLEVQGKTETEHVINKQMLWIYPAVSVASGILLVVLFLA